MGGVVAYTAFRHQVQTTATSADIQVQSFSVRKISRSISAYYAGTVKNVGTVRLENGTVVVDPAS